MSTQDATDRPADSERGSDRPSAGDTGSDQADDAGSTRADEQPELDTVEVEHAPSREAQVVTVVAALVGMGLTAPFTVPSIPFGVAGFVIVAASMFVVYSIKWLSIGISMVLVGAFLSGALGVLSTEVLLLGTGATIVAWDAGQHGIVLGEQVGRQTRTRRNLLVHVAATVFTITLVSSIGFAVSIVTGDGYPAPAVSVVVLGVVVLAWVFRR